MLCVVKESCEREGEGGRGEKRGGSASRRESAGVSRKPKCGWREEVWGKEKIGRAQKK